MPGCDDVDVVHPALPKRPQLCQQDPQAGKRAAFSSDAIASDRTPVRRLVTSGRTASQVRLEANRPTHLGPQQFCSNRLRSGSEKSASQSTAFVSCCPPPLSLTTLVRLVPASTPKRLESSSRRPKTSTRTTTSRAKKPPRKRV